MPELRDQVNPGFGRIHLAWFFFSFLVWLTDRTLKQLVLHDFVWPAQDSWFSIGYYPNPNFFADIPLPSALTISLGSIVLLSVVILLSYAWLHRMHGIVLGGILITLGGLSNLWDRIMHGVVVDYVGIAQLPVFNLADLLIVSGVSLYAFVVFRGYRKQHDRASH